MSLIGQLKAKYKWFPRLFDIYKFAAERVESAQLTQVASSLTLTTILSIVPAIAVVLAAFTAFPLFEQYRDSFEQLVLRSMLPTEYSEQILTYIKNFAGQATNLTVFGLIGLGVTALLCIYNIDNALNNTFNVTKFRSLWQRFLIYWAFLTLGPVIIVLSLSASTYVTSMAFMGKITALIKWVVPLSQFFLQGFLLTIIYFFVPNCRVLWRDAFTGGFFISAVLTVFRWVFGIYVLNGSFNTIYGAFSVIPVLLTWTYIMWMLVLAGAALTATLPIFRAKRFKDFRKTGNDFLSAVALLEILYHAKESGKPGVLDIDLARKIEGYPEEVTRILTRLEPKHYVIGTPTGNGHTWVLLANADRTTLKGVFEEFCIDPDNSLLQNGSPEERWFEDGLAAPWLNRTIADVFMTNEEWRSQWKKTPSDAPFSYLR